MENEQSNDLAAAEAVLGKKWFWPILRRLSEFEGKLLPVLPLLEPVLDDGAPDWAFRCVLDVALADGDLSGFRDLASLDSRAVGRMVGSKLAVCEMFAEDRLGWRNLTAEQIRAAAEAAMKNLPADLAAEMDAETAAEWLKGGAELMRKFSEELAPEMREIKRYAAALADAERGMEELDYLQGYAQGMTFMGRVRERMKPPQNKRQRDARARHCVFLFAAVHGAEIDQSKRDTSWPELYEEFLRTFRYGVEIDEDTFKKVLSRKGLGVGRAGRPVPVNRDAGT